MATNFPSSLDTSTTIPAESSSTSLAVNHPTAHQNIQDAIEAIEAKIGVDSSAVTTSHDYKLSGVTGSDKAVSKTGTETLTNKTLTSPTITGATITTSSVNGVTLQTAGSATDFLAANGTYQTGSVANASSTVKGIVELATSAEITAGTATGGTGAALVVTPDQLLAARPVTDVQAFTTAGTTSWTKPANAKWVEVTVIGAGGAGGSGTAGLNTSGGGGGGYGFKRMAASALGSTETVIVGAGGTAGANGSTGGNGGSSSFGTSTLLKANGGSGGGSSAAAGGTVANGDIKFAGGASNTVSGAGVDTATDPSPRGGGAGGYNGGTPASAIAGGAGGSFITNYVKAGGAGGTAGVNNGTAGTSTSGGLIIGGVGGGGGGYNGSGTNTGGNGGAGGFPGGGGGGSSGTNNTGGNGADGMVYVVTYF